MTDVNIGGGQTVKRHHLPKNMLHEFDQANAAMIQTQANIRSWVRPLHALQAPASVSGAIICDAIGRTGRTYDLSEPGGTLLVDERDLDVFTALGFTPVPSGAAPTTGLRPGLVFLDTSLNAYMRFDGANWSAVTLA